MSKTTQRKQSAYTAGKRLGERIYSHYKPADRKAFNVAFRRIYNGKEDFYPIAFAAACHAFQNCKVAAAKRKELEEFTDAHV